LWLCGDRVLQFCVSMATEEYLVFVHLIEARGLAGLYVVLAVAVW
jgi:hypothetical protein